MQENTHISKVWNVLENKLYGMPKPEEKDLEAISNKGIKAIVSLLEDKASTEKYNDYGFEKLWLPIIDNQAPTLKQVEKLVEFIDKQIKKSNPVAIHCQGGKGRTGTMIASYLIAKGASFDEAMKQINSKQENAIKKDFQLDFLKNLSLLKNKE